jgi:septum formation inhibitor MinC
VPKLPIDKPIVRFKLASVDDLINIPPRALQTEPNDETKLVARMKEEIQNIANTSKARRTEIVDGWKKSQIYRAYIEMGNDSMQQGKSIADVATFRKTSGKPFLTEPQFHAVSEVSRLLLR